MPKPCKHPGCGRQSRALGYCPGHYRQFKAGETLRPLQLRGRGLRLWSVRLSPAAWEAARRDVEGARDLLERWAAKRKEPRR